MSDGDLHHGSNPSPSPRDRRLTATALFGDALHHLLSSPAVALPFFVAAAMLTGVDYLRLRDPVPVEITSYSLSEGIDIQSQLYPTGLSETTTPLDALVDLKLHYLGWVLGLELLAFVAIVVAGAVVVTRVTGESLSLVGVVRYGIFVVALGFVPSVNFTGPSILVGLPLLAVAYYVTVHLFVLPVLLVQGHGFQRAARRSWGLVSGHGWSAFGLLVGLGLGYSLLAAFPAVGPGLSTTVFGTVHAVALGLFVRRAQGDDDSPAASPTSATKPANTSD